MLKYFLLKNKISLFSLWNIDYLIYFLTKINRIMGNCVSDSVEQSAILQDG
jgi:hypothetical protein